MFVDGCCLGHDTSCSRVDEALTTVYNSVSSLLSSTSDESLVCLGLCCCTSLPIACVIGPLSAAYTLSFAMASLLSCFARVTLQHKTRNPGNPSDPGLNLLLLAAKYGHAAVVKVAI
jgi:hypothetical protein